MAAPGCACLPACLPAFLPSFHTFLSILPCPCQQVPPAPLHLSFSLFVQHSVLGLCRLLIPASGTSPFFLHLRLLSSSPPGRELQHLRIVTLACFPPPGTTWVCLPTLKLAFRNKESSLPATPTLEEGRTNNSVLTLLLASEGRRHPSTVLPASS